MSERAPLKKQEKSEEKDIVDLEFRDGIYKSAEEEHVQRFQSSENPPLGSPDELAGFERKLRQNVTDWQEKRARREEELAQQEPTVESQVVPAVEAEPAAQTTVETASAAPEEDMDAAQRVAKKLAEEIPDGERTRAELYAKLRALVEGAGETMSEKGERFKAYFSRRSEELDAQAERMGIVERAFRSVGEEYAKVDWKLKLALGVSLAFGASAFSIPGAVACLSGIAVQRIAGLSGAFLKYEKKAQDDKWGKEKAMAKAIGQAAFMTGGMLTLVHGFKEGIEYAKEHEVAEATQEWLKQHWPSQVQIKEHLPDWVKERLHLAGAGRPSAPEAGAAGQSPAPSEAMVQSGAHEEPPLVTQEEAEEHTRQVLAAEEATREGERLREAFGGEAAAADAAKEMSASSAHEAAPSPFEETDKHIAAAEEHFKNIQKLAAEQQAAFGESKEASPDAVLPAEEPGVAEAQGRFKDIAEKALWSGGEGHLSRIEGTPLQEQAAEAASFVENNHSEVVKFQSLDADGNVVDKLAYWDGKNVAIEIDPNSAPQSEVHGAPFGRDASGLPFSSEQEAKDFEDLKHATHDPRETGEWPGGPAKEEPGFFERLFGSSEASPSAGRGAEEPPASSAPESSATDQTLPNKWAEIKGTAPTSLEEMRNLSERARNALEGGHLVEIQETPIQDQAEEAVTFINNNHGDVVHFRSMDQTGRIIDKLAFWNGENVEIETDPRSLPTEGLQNVPSPEIPVSAPEASRVEPTDNPHDRETSTDSGDSGKEPHAFQSLMAESLGGKFAYAPDGTVQSLSFDGISQKYFENINEAKKLLADNYVDTLSKIPSKFTSSYFVNQKLTEGVSSVGAQALRVFNDRQILEELVKKGAGESPEADFLRKEINFVIKTTEEKYGAVFKK